MRKTRYATLATATSTTAAFFLILSLRERYCNGFSLPPIIPGTINPKYRKQRRCCQNLFPTSLEAWESCDVEDWLSDIGFGRYSRGFAADFGGIGVDGDRLIYLGTEDQLDHIEYQLSLIGVDDESDQRVLGSTIIGLVAASEVTPELLESLVGMVPAEYRDKNNEKDKDEDIPNDAIDPKCDGQPDFDI